MSTPRWKPTPDIPVAAAVADALGYTASTLDDLTVQVLDRLEAFYLAIPMDSPASVDVEQLLLTMDAAHGTVHALASAVESWNEAPDQPFDPSLRLLRLRPLLEALAGPSWTVNIRAPMGITTVQPEARVMDDILLLALSKVSRSGPGGEISARVDVDPSLEQVGLVLEGLGETNLTDVVARAPGLVAVAPGRLRLELPIAEQGGVPREPSSSQPRLLLVDDDGALREGLVEILQREGFEVVTAVSAEKALECLAQESVDLLVTDVVLPGINGMALAVLARRRRPQLPVLLMSGYRRFFEHLGGTIAVGPTTFVAKPFAPLELVDAIWALVKTAGR